MVRKPWKADGLDLAPILVRAKRPHPNSDSYCTREQDHGLNLALDNRLIELAEPALKHRKTVHVALPIVNTNRTVGTMLSHTLVKKWGERGLPSELWRFLGSRHHARTRRRQQ